MDPYQQQTSIVPLASYNLKVLPGLPTLAIDEDFPVAIRLTMAALDPTDPVDENNEASTLKIIKRPMDFPEDGIVYGSDDDSEGDEDDDEEEEEEKEEEEEAKPKKKDSKKDSKESRKDKKSKKDESDEEMKDGEDDEDDEDDDEDFDDMSYEIEDYVICTLSPKTAFQQSIDLVITADEDVMFEVTGSYPVHLTGNYIDHPYDNSEDDYEDSDLSEDDSEDDDDLDSEDYDLGDEDDSEEEEEISGKIEELASDGEESKKESGKQSKKDSKKRAAAEEEEEQEQEQKQSKKQKKNVEFKKGLEQGPTGPAKDEKKPSTKKLEGGVTVEDRTVGEGPTAKKGNKVGVRYIGKLADGKVFDSNTKGKPFYFNLGKGEVIKGWEIGVIGMAVKGERRIVIPANMAYGKQKLPGIPANSELTFDVKLVNIK